MNTLIEIYYLLSEKNIFFFKGSSINNDVVVYC